MGKKLTKRQRARRVRRKRQQREFIIKVIEHDGLKKAEMCFHGMVNWLRRYQPEVIEKSTWEIK